MGMLFFEGCDNLFLINGLLYHTVWNSLDFIYTTVQKVYGFNYNEFFVSIETWLHDNNFYILSEIYQHLFFIEINFEIYLNYIYSTYFCEYIKYLEISENTLRRYIASQDLILFSLFEPSLTNSNQIVENLFFYFYGVDYTPYIFDFLQKKNLIVPINLVLQLSIVFYFYVLFLCMFFSLYSSLNKKEFTADIDHAISNVSVEAEKEIFAVEDAIFLIFCVLFLFGAYFYFLAVSYNLNYVEITILFFAAPGLFFILLWIPINLLFDFGLLFNLYLRGASNTSSFLSELMFDYIGITAFFTRLFVQFVRLILMFVVYCIMHDVVLLQMYPATPKFQPDSFWKELTSVQFNAYSIGYYLFVQIPVRLLYWTYEILHTFFVVTVQFAAFFTIAFWLFLLFYTYFVYEKFENYFISLRKTRSKIKNQIEELKQI